MALALVSSPLCILIYKAHMNPANERSADGLGVEWGHTGGLLKDLIWVTKMVSARDGHITHSDIRTRLI